MLSSPHGQRDNTDFMARSARPKLTRSQRSELTRTQLIESAALMVGKFGYEGASIARICEHAGIAQGTFYNYFETRQEILELLPGFYGEIMIAYIRNKVSGTARGLDREVARLDAFIDFFLEHSVSERIINEAPIMAVEGYKRFYRVVRDDYRRALERDMAAGAVRPMDDTDLLVLVDMLIAIRNGLSQQFLLGELTERGHDRATIVALYRDIMAKAIFS